MPVMCASKVVFVFCARVDESAAIWSMFQHIAQLV